MPKEIILHDAYINGAGFALEKKKGAKTGHINFTMPWTKGIAKAMKWPEPEPDTQGEIKLLGGMSVHTFAFVAGGKTFKLGSGMLEQFKLVQVKDSKFELRAQYVCLQPSIITEAERYADTTSKAKGQMQMSYDYIEPTKQESKPDERQGKLEAVK